MFLVQTRKNGLYFACLAGVTKFRVLRNIRGDFATCPISQSRQFLCKTFLVEKRGSETNVCTVVYHGQRWKGFFKVLCIYTKLYSLLLLVSRHEQQGKETPTCHTLVHLNCNFSKLRLFHDFNFKDLLSQSKDLLSQSKDLLSQSKDLLSQSKDLLSQSKAFS